MRFLDRIEYVAGIAIVTGGAVAILLLVLGDKPRSEPPVPKLVAEAGWWVTCPKSGKRVAQFSRAAVSWQPISASLFDNWQPGFEGHTQAGEALPTCGEGDEPFARANGGIVAVFDVHTDHGWRPLRTFEK